jgi:xanthine dehydrogenase accessory factor
VRSLDRALGPDLGQCCGGRVTLLFERFDRDDRTAVENFAAAETSGELITRATPDAHGRLQRHIASGEASRLEPDDLCRRLDDGSLLERFGDPRTPLYLFGAGHVGTALAAALAPLPFAVTWIDPRAGAFPDHVPSNIHRVIDLVIAALRAERFPYVGLIGSETKRARFVAAMRKTGVPGIERLVCPIGLPGIRDKAPAAIAAAVAAQLLIVREAQTDAASHAPHHDEAERRGGRRA